MARDKQRSAHVLRIVAGLQIRLDVLVGKLRNVHILPSATLPADVQGSALMLPEIADRQAAQLGHTETTGEEEGDDCPVPLLLRRVTALHRDPEQLRNLLVGVVLLLRALLFRQLVVVRQLHAMQNVGHIRDFRIDRVRPTEERVERHDVVVQRGGFLVLLEGIEPALNGSAGQSVNRLLIQVDAELRHAVEDPDEVFLVVFQGPRLLAVGNGLAVEVDHRIHTHWATLLSCRGCILYHILPI